MTYQSRKICVFQNVLKTTTSTPPPPPPPNPIPPAKSKVLSRRKSQLATAVIGGDLYLFQTRFVIGCENNKDGDIRHNNAPIPENNR